MNAISGYRMRATDELICLEPERGADACIVWLHGLGASMTDLLPVATALKLRPAPCMLLPQAPMQTVTINAHMRMPAWYDILYIGPDRLDEDAAGLEASAGRLRELLARHAPGIPASRTVLAGFSQGGALALYTGLRHPEPFAGLLTLSGYLPPATTQAPWQRPPVLCLHGRYDEVVPMSYARQGFEALQAAGCPARWLDYPVGHTIAADAVAVMQQWLAECLPATTAAKTGT